MNIIKKFIIYISMKEGDDKMKYTKYQYKKKNNGIKFLTSLLMTTLAAISIGVFAAWFLLKIIPNIETLGKINNKPQVEENNSNANSEGVDTENFDIIQCGYFSKEENAKQVLSKIDSEFNSFIVKDSEGKYRVLAGITKEEGSEEIIQKLKEKGIETAKIKLALNKNDEIQNQIIEITNGYLEILNTASKEEVKEINTTDFKAWIKDLKEISEGNSIDILKDYKGHMDSLPEVINKSNIVSELEYIYSILSKLQK